MQQTAKSSFDCGGNATRTTDGLTPNGGVQVGERNFDALDLAGNDGEVKEDNLLDGLRISFSLRHLDFDNVGRLAHITVAMAKVFFAYLDSRAEKLGNP